MRMKTAALVYKKANQNKSGRTDGIKSVQNRVIGINLSICARAAQGLLMGRAATFSQLKVPIGFCHGDPTPITFWLHYLLPIDFRSIKRLTSDFLNAQVSELRTFSSPNKSSLGSSNSIGNEIGEVA